MARDSVDEMDPEYQKKVYEVRVHSPSDIGNSQRQSEHDAHVDTEQRPPPPLPRHLHQRRSFSSPPLLQTQVNFVVDTGAQSTILSADVADATGISRVMDERNAVDIVSVVYMR